MNLTELIQKSGLTVIARDGNGDVPVLGVTRDSRQVKPGALFVAISGTRTDGNTFIADAIGRGAVAVVTDAAAPAGIAVPWARVENGRAALGVLGRTLWGVDTGAMSLVGITGTNGKTTIAHLYKELFEQRFDPARVWMFGTIDYQVGTSTLAAPNTTPESLDIFRAIGAAELPPQAVIMEVSSHSLALDRVGGLAFDLAVFTNLTQDHLDFHVTMENYYQAKKRLFCEYVKRDGCRVVNLDNAWGRRLAGEIGRAGLITYGKAIDADVRIVKYACGWDGTAIDLVAFGKPLSFRSRLCGKFNVYNMAALYAGAAGLSIDQAAVERAFASITTVNGRMDLLPLDATFSVVVDYAHTPDALVNILQAARQVTKGKIVCVFGCGGDRDRTKRPLMGRAVAEYADEAVVTSDNPRSEKPQAIIGEILEGMPLDFPHLTIPDRREAIGKALQLARRDDCVIIAGKGHETYQEINGVRHPFSDRETATTLWNEMKHHA